MTLDNARNALSTEQTTFAEIAKQPNTLERNIVLAVHRQEIGRLQKFIAKAAL